MPRPGSVSGGTRRDPAGPGGRGVRVSLAEDRRGHLSTDGLLQGAQTSHRLFEPARDFGYCRRSALHHPGAALGFQPASLEASIMASSAPSSLKSRSREENETELARLRRMHSTLPPEKEAAGKQIEKRMGELEDALRNPAGAGAQESVPKLAMWHWAVIGGVAIFGLFIGLLGIMAVGRFVGM